MKSYIFENHERKSGDQRNKSVHKYESSSHPSRPKLVYVRIDARAGKTIESAVEGEVRGCIVDDVRWICIYHIPLDPMKPEQRGRKRRFNTTVVVS